MFLFSNFKVTASFEVIACSASIAMLRSLAADSRYLVFLGGDSTTLFQPKIGFLGPLVTPVVTISSEKGHGAKMCEVCPETRRSSDGRSVFS